MIFANLEQIYVTSPHAGFVSHGLSRGLHENGKSQSLYASNNNSYTDVITINVLATSKKCNFKACSDCLVEIRNVKPNLCHETLANFIRVPFPSGSFRKKLRKYANVGTSVSLCFNPL